MPYSGNSVDQISSENYENDPHFMATHNDDTDSLKEAAEAVNGHDLDLDGKNGLDSPRLKQVHSADRSDLEHDNSVSGRKRKRSHSGVSNNSQLDGTVAFTPKEDSNSSNKQPSRDGGHKRISDELDSDDELIMQMRENGFRDRQIAQRLQKEGRVRYDEKSISTRITRIRQAKAEKVDFLLKEGYKEWEYKEDKLLLQAYSLADIEINYEIERVRAWRFRKVSDHMRRLNKNALFSADACRQRYNDLVEGTARIPTALDDDPEGRRIEMEAYCIDREKTRRKEQAEEALKEATKAEQKSRKAQKAEESANKRARRAAEKAQRATQRAEKAKIRAARATEVSRNDQIKQKDTAQTAEKSTPATPSPAAAPAGAPAKKTKTKPTSNLTATLASKAKVKPITSETPDPRTKLSLADLKRLCKDRSIDLPSKRNKTTLLQVLKHTDERYSLSSLKTMCREKGLNVTGTKTILKYRLALAVARSCASFGKRTGSSPSTGKEGKKGYGVQGEAEEDDLVMLKIGGV